MNDDDAAFIERLGARGARGSDEYPNPSATPFNMRAVTATAKVHRRDAFVGTIIASDCYSLPIKLTC